jgi:4-hydroxy-3-polyprenylbenzoate decarboxylase
VTDRSPLVVPRRLVVGITGASGSAIGIRILELLQEVSGVETHLVISAWGRRTLEYETKHSFRDVAAMADCHYRPTDQSAPPSSGSFLVEGMIIAPCSMKSLAAIAHGFGSDLITRAADVCLKERRRLVLVPRESPLNEIHLRNMLTLSTMGASIVNPVPAFYTQPATVDDIVEQIAIRTLDQVGIHLDAPRWQGPGGLTSPYS